MQSNGKFRLALLGAFDLRSPEGRDLHIRSKKARALVALLALCERGTRTRGWLQGILWSRVEKREAQASLRRELCNLRASLGCFASDLISVKGDFVTLSVSRCKIDCIQELEATTETNNFPLSDLLEGLDLNGEEAFEEWLRTQRSSLGQRIGSTASARVDKSTASVPDSNRDFPRRDLRLATTPINLDVSASNQERQFVAARAVSLRRPTVLLARYKVNGGFESTLKDHFFAGIAASLSSRFDAMIEASCVKCIDDADIELAKDDILVDCSVTLSPNTIHIAVSVRCNDIGATYLADRLNLTNTDIISSPEFVRLMARTVEAIQQAIITRSLSGVVPSPQALFSNARKLTFALDKVSLAEADRLCAIAGDLTPRGEYIAWRALVRIISMFQFRTDSFLPEQKEIAELAQEGLRISPTDATALAIASQLEYLFGASKRSARRLAEMAVQSDALNPLAWAALSNIQTACYDYAAALHSATQAVNVGSGAGETCYFEFYRCMAASGLRDYPAALAYAKTSCLLSSGFAAPRRYVVALTAVTGSDYDLKRACESMRRIESTFALHHIMEQSYPVSTMREISLIDDFVSATTRYNKSDFL